MVSEDTISTLLDVWSIKILSRAMERPVTVQEISEELGIPQATCYRKFKELIEKGLLVETEKVLVEGQKRRAAYVSTLESLKIEVTSKGIRVSWKAKPKPAEIWDSLKRFSKK
ncbi:ArsR/SmtB family transcription factor [Archaeoglobus veneficus]|uniref:Transcriptional regulator TrmB n=1 Tax=Archaeoglobus veneficus (strain DSM 11195 / SNP6) TaxID=693661 RepID=F2KNE4_ARCVS|nr:winged helix-turn-helix domain-containing protein [Archaeoglobus veneficus]AEA47346.1 transcriptional regulator TrmB [Archaeoglobus veneficus SNP6]